MTDHNKGQTSPDSNKNAPELNTAEETERIADSLRRSVYGNSAGGERPLASAEGGNSSVVLSLCARAFGQQRVLGVLLPEKESSPDSIEL